MNLVKNHRQDHQKPVTNDENANGANQKVLNPFHLPGHPSVSSSTGVPKYLSSVLPPLLYDENLIISFIFRSVWFDFPAHKIQLMRIKAEFMKSKTQKFLAKTKIKV